MHKRTIDKLLFFSKTMGIYKQKMSIILWDVQISRNILRNQAILYALIGILNQRTNGPVNAHLIYGPIRFLKAFTINKHGGHSGHLTCTIYINFLSHFQRRLHT